MVAILKIYVNFSWTDRPIDSKFAWWSGERYRAILALLAPLLFPLGSLSRFDIFGNGVLLVHTLEGVSSVANFITTNDES